MKVKFLKVNCSNNFEIENQWEIGDGIKSNLIDEEYYSYLTEMSEYYGTDNLDNHYYKDNLTGIVCGDKHYILCVDETDDIFHIIKDDIEILDNPYTEEEWENWLSYIKNIWNNAQNG
jgi:hypothetical protein